MAGITIIGLGRSDERSLDPVARAALADAEVYLRAEPSGALATLPALQNRLNFEAELSESDPIRERLDAWIDRLLAVAETQDLVYAVPGDGLLADATVRLLRARADEAGIPVTVIPGQSMVMDAASVLPGGAFGPGLQLVDALDLALVVEEFPFAGGQLPLSPLRPALIFHLGCPPIVAAAHSALRHLYPDDTPVTLLESRSQARTVPLHEVTSSDRAWALFLPPGDPLTQGRTSDALEQIVARLRAPGGCPWDREQTHHSLMQSSIEEAYEVLEAIERGDVTELAEELGDLLLQAYLHAQIATESGDFTLADVFEAVNTKLVRRHPHVFGDVTATSAAEVLHNWDRIKQEERAKQGVTEEESPLGRIPVALPALMRAQTVLRRALRQKLIDLDAGAFRQRLVDLANDRAELTPTSIAEALVAIAYLATQADIDAEQALREQTKAIEDAARRHASSSSTGRLA